MKNRLIIPVQIGILLTLGLLLIACSGSKNEPKEMNAPNKAAAMHQAKPDGKPLVNEKVMCNHCHQFNEAGEIVFIKRKGEKMPEGKPVEKPAEETSKTDKTAHK